MTGRNKEVSDADFLSLFIEHEEPIIGTGDVAADLGYSSQGAKKRLDSLAARDLVQSKDLGNATAYWITQDGIEYLWARDELPGDQSCPTHHSPS